MSKGVKHEQTKKYNENQLCSHHKLHNNWYTDFFNDLVNKYNSVEIINFIENNLYDELLVDNIVYIKLVDASAINTLIECAVRYTPIIINKHPAVIEILGNNYPLYIENLEYNNKLYVTINKINKANLHF